MSMGGVCVVVVVVVVDCDAGDHAVDNAAAAEA